MYSNLTKMKLRYASDARNHASSKNDWCETRLLLHSIDPKRYSIKVGSKSWNFGGKKHICHLCDKAFAGKQAHRNHLLTHKPENSLLFNTHHISFSKKRLLINDLLKHKDVRSRICNRVRRSNLKILRGTKGDVCNSAPRSNRKKFWNSTGSKKKHLYKVCNKKFPRKASIDARNNKYSELEKSGCQVSRKGCVGKQNTKKSHVCDVYNVAVYKLKKTRMYKRGNPTQDCNRKTRYVNLIDENLQTYEVSNPAYGSHLKIQSSTEFSKDEKRHIYEKLGNVQGKESKSPLAAHIDKKHCMYDTFNRIRVSKFKNWIMAPSEKQSCVHQNPNIVQGFEIKSNLARKDEEFHIYEELDLIANVKHEDLNQDEGREIKSNLKNYRDEESHIYEALDFTEDSEVKCHLITHQEDSPAYKDMNLAKRSEVKNCLLTYKYEDSPVYEAMDLVQASEVNSLLLPSKDEDSSRYEALDLVQDSEAKKDFGTHINEQSYLCSGSQESNIKTRFTSYKDEILPVLKVLNFTEERKQKLDPKLPDTPSGMKYVCHICDEVFAVKFCLQSHLLTHPRENHTCQVCNIAFSTKGLFENHLSAHQYEELHDEVFAQQSNIKSHLLFHKNVKRCKVTKSFRLKTRRIFRHATGKKFVCRVCDKAFIVEGCFQSHMLTHQREPYHVCHLCYAAFSEEINLQSHLMTHDKEAPHLPRVNLSSQRINFQTRLPICTRLKMSYKYFPLKVKSKKYSFKPSGIKKHQCNDCNKVFAFRWSLQRHLHTHTGAKLYAFRKKECVESFFLINTDESKKLNQLEEDNLDIPPPLPLYTSLVKSSDFLSLRIGSKTRRYKRHQVRKHKCTMCSKEFAMKLNLRHHLLTHTNEKLHGDFSECSILMPTERRDESHVYNQAEGSNLNFFIRTMGKKCFSLKAKRKIYRLKHTKVKKHKCNVCSKSFAMKWSLKRHRLAHAHETSHSCRVCHITFSEKANLESHLLTHGQAFIAKRSHTFFQFTRTSDSKHACDVCNQVFSRKVFLKVHNLKHVVAKKQVCIVCDKAFAMKWSLQRHLLTHNSHLLEPIHMC